MSRDRIPLLYANLSPMLPEPPRALASEFEGESHPEVPQSGAAGDEPTAEHALQICPNCGEQLAGFRCKLICANCGYYLSCSDYY